MTPAEQDILGSRQEESESEDDLVDEDSSSSGCEADMVRCCARSCEVFTIYYLVKSCEVFTIYYLVMFFSSVCIIFPHLCELATLTNIFSIYTII